ncbi:sugar transferase [Sneathiella sp.]|uniref:sugar transferase n=1 Tax=Sneathiella sp. TaxID=1964365 RepID=UPI00356A5041
MRALSSAAGHRVYQLLSSGLFQFVVGTVVVALLPAVLRWPDEAVVRLAEQVFDASIPGSALSFTVGLVIVRQFVLFPYTQGFVYIVPVFIITFGFMVILFFFVRIDYSRYQLICSFIFSIAWGFFFVYCFSRTRRLRLALVPFGNTTWLTPMPALEPVKLDAPHIEPGEYDAIVADLRADMPPQWERFLAQCALQSVPVFHVKYVAEWLTGRVHIEHLWENQFGSLHLPRLFEVLKRTSDIAAIVLTAPIVVPLLLVIVCCVKLDSSGPALFIQDRIGFRGKKFRMVKFRTMRVGHNGAHYTSPNDERITRAGVFLRRYRLDELPQVMNVLRGEMSWIGPRPEAVELARLYEREIPFYAYHHIVRPGITGWAQVNQGQTIDVDQVSEKLQYDFFYIKNFSLWLDLLIACKTVRTLATGYGAH